MVTIGLYVVVLFIIVFMAYTPVEYVKLDMEEINEQTISFFGVFSSNIVLIIKNYGLGLITFGSYSIFLLIQNVLSLGIIANSLILNNHPHLFYKMIPHGLIEIFGIVVSVTVIMYCFYKILRVIPCVIKRQLKIKDSIKELVTFVVATILLQFLIFISAGVIEFLISLVKVM